MTIFSSKESITIITHHYLHLRIHLPTKTLNRSQNVHYTYVCVIIENINTVFISFARPMSSVSQLEVS